jgi:hypothetical protein
MSQPPQRGSEQEEGAGDPSWLFARAGYDQDRAAPSPTEGHVTDQAVLERRVDPVQAAGAVSPDHDEVVAVHVGDSGALRRDPAQVLEPQPIGSCLEPYPVSSPHEPGERSTFPFVSS